MEEEVQDEEVESRCPSEEREEGEKSDQREEEEEEDAEEKRSASEKREEGETDATPVEECRDRDYTLVDVELVDQESCSWP